MTRNSIYHPPEKYCKRRLEAPYVRGIGLRSITYDLNERYWPECAEVANIASRQSKRVALKYKLAARRREHHQPENINKTAQSLIPNCQ